MNCLFWKLPGLRNRILAQDQEHQIPGQLERFRLGSELGDTIDSKSILFLRRQMLKCLGVNCHDFCNSYISISLCVSVCIPISVSVARREKANAWQNVNN